jgi:hypothetical protein
MQKVYQYPDPKTTDPHQRKVQRILEVIPAICTWATLIGMVIFSFFLPVWMAVLIIAYDIYWIHRVVFVSYYSIKSYFQLLEGQKIDWFERCTHIKEPAEYSQEIAKRIVDNENLLPKVKNNSYRKELKRIIKIDREFLKEVSKIQAEDVLDWRNIVHVVAFPTATEPAEVIDPSIEAIQNCVFPNDQIIVLLATEERENEEKRLAKVKFLQEKYKGVFRDFVVTTHEVLDGELKCKGSNMTYAGRKLQKYFDEKGIDYKRVVLSNFDCDTIAHPQYLSALTYYYISNPNRLKRAYQPIPLYHNNIWDTNAFVRMFAVSSSFWHMFQATRVGMVTFSSHSEPFDTLVKFDFWPTNMISEDSIVYWKGYAYYDGDYYVQPIHLPVSLDAVIAETFWKTSVNQYKQQRRWAYGIENFAPMMRAIWPNKKIGLWEKLKVGFERVEGMHSWATTPYILAFLGWLPIILGDKEFNQSTIAHNLPIMTSYLMRLALVGLVISTTLSFFLLPKRPDKYSGKKYIYMILLQWALFPVIALITGVPAIDSQTRILFKKYFTEFWVTDKIKVKD